MTEIKKIIACVDLSGYTKETLEYALALSCGTKSDILVLHVINDRDIDAVRAASRYYPGSFDIERYREGARTDRQGRIRNIISEYFPEYGEKFQVMIREGNPFEEILMAVEGDVPDLVVVGNKGKGNFAKTLFGSVAEKVFRHCPVPVVSVRRQAPAE